jgi:GNAT superfamily N-acetyltransferase/predicted nucleic acid-binding protein
VIGNVKVTIKSSPTEVASFVQEVRKNADLNREMLGFLPAPAYDEAAMRGNLFVAVTDERGAATYAGHLFFGGVFPHARIVQLFVVPEFRSRGVGRKLLQFLVDLMEKHSYLQISAGVASDLEANKFYARMGFEISRTKPGGLTRKRVINIQVKQLNTLDLFKLSFHDAQGLALVDRLANRQPVYVIDLNVFWDAVKRRPRSQYAADVVSAAFHHLIHVVVTKEFIRELQRNSPSSLSDPALELALSFPILSEPDSLVLDSLVDQVATLVFPSKSTLSSQDRSDLVHLATAIHNSANAFVTSDNAILQAGSAISSCYGVEVIHVQELSTVLKATKNPIPAFRARLSSETLYVLAVLAGDSSTVRDFLQAASAPPEFCDDFLGTGGVSTSRMRVAVTSDKEMVCLASWDASAGLQGRANMRLVANEEHAAVQPALDCIVGQVCKEASRLRPALLRLTVPPGQVQSRKAALLHGFQPSESGSLGGEAYLQKLCIGRPITNKNWAQVQRHLEQCSGLLFDQGLPRIDDEDVQIPFTASDGTKRTMALSRLEKMLSPTIFALSGRTGVIAPIRRGYAEQLLETQQMSLTPKREASLFSERVYFSAARNARILASGTALLFYESGGDGGRACVTAVSRVLSTEIHAKSEVSELRLRHGVVDASKLDNLTSDQSLAITSFDNVIIFDRPVKLDRLREIGGVDGANLVRARRITHEQLVTILEEGFNLG